MNLYSSKNKKQIVDLLENHESSKNHLLMSTKLNNLTNVNQSAKNKIFNQNISENKNMNINTEIPKFLSTSIKNFKCISSKENKILDNHSDFSGMDEYLNSNIKKGFNNQNKNLNNFVYDLNLSHKLISIGENNKNLFNLKEGNLINISSNISPTKINYYKEKDKDYTLKKNINIIQVNADNKFLESKDLTTKKMQSLNAIDNTRYVSKNLNKNDIINIENSILKIENHFPHFDNNSHYYPRNNISGIKNPFIPIFIFQLNMIINF